MVGHLAFFPCTVVFDGPNGLQPNDRVTVGNSTAEVRAASIWEGAIGVVVAPSEGNRVQVALYGFGLHDAVTPEPRPEPPPRRFRTCDWCGCPFPKNPCHYCGVEHDL